MGWRPRGHGPLQRENTCRDHAALGRAAADSGGVKRWRTPPRTPLVLARAGMRLVVRLATEGPRQACLMLHEQRLVCSATLLQSLDLTARQAQVLFWVAHGKSNAVVGTILGMREGTVRKHLEHISTRLGVEHPNAAMYRAMKVLGLPKE